MDLTDTLFFTNNRMHREIDLYVTLFLYYLCVFVPILVSAFIIFYLCLKNLIFDFNK